MGLSNTFCGTVRSHLIQQEPVPKVKTVLAKICKEEQHHILAQTLTTEDRGSDDVAFVVAKTYRTSSYNSRLVCSHCTRNGYEIGKCFHLVGYPYWWPKNRTNSSWVTTIVESQIRRAEAEAMDTPEISSNKETL